jgi:hypothetical protein
MVTIQPTDVFMFSVSVCLVLVISIIRLLFCLTIQCLITQLFSVIFCSDTGIVFQVF